MSLDKVLNSVLYSSFFLNLNQCKRLLLRDFITDLDYKKNSQYRNKEESYKVVIDYYYKGKITKVYISISCLQKDWDKEWRNKSSKNPIKSSDKDYKQKTLL